eukprot:4528862-Amphidinium_carterae.1
MLASESAEEREAGLDPTEKIFNDPDEFDADSPNEPVDKDWVPLEQQQLDIKRLHDNLGHPSLQELIKMLQRGRTYKPIMRWVKHHFHCLTCEASVRPGFANPSQTSRKLLTQSTLWRGLVFR